MAPLLDHPTTSKTLVVAQLDFVHALAEMGLVGETAPAFHAGHPLDSGFACVSVPGQPCSASSLSPGLFPDQKNVRLLSRFNWRSPVWPWAGASVLSNLPKNYSTSTMNEEEIVYSIQNPVVERPRDSQGRCPLSRPLVPMAGRHRFIGASGRGQARRAGTACSPGCTVRRLWKRPAAASDRTGLRLSA
jgi:hypothetical protein